MTKADITNIQAELGMDLPGPVKDFLLNRAAIPNILQDDFFSDAQALTSRNRQLRRGGYYHLPWGPNCLAVGTDPGDCVYYFDLGSPNYPAYFADHDFDDPADFKKLADSPKAFIAYLTKLAEDFEQQEKDVQ
jgi:hypothetical protein